ncbi:MAG: DUF4339 domain-containing protein [Labilithrix sp.]|nr:DUF4339 domain-containing protein [Labilithrix sp.]
MNDVTSSGRHNLDIWTVRLPSGETRGLTLDELDQAFDSGVIDAKTPVLKAGDLQWSTLGQIAGLDTTPPPVSVVPNSIMPVALDTPYGVDLSDLRGPVALDVGALGPDDSAMRALRPRRGKKIFGAFVALAVVAGLSFAAFRAKPTLERAYASALRRAPVAHVEPAPPKPEPPPVVAPPPAPAPAPPAPAEPAAAAIDPSIPTMTASSLPNAPAGKGKGKAKKAKRGK